MVPLHPVFPLSHPSSCPPDLQGGAEAESGQPGLSSVSGPQFVGFSLTSDSSLSSSPMKTMIRPPLGQVQGESQGELGRILGAI